jgi:hypothetical protein
MGPRDDLVLPSVSERADWEVELGVVIGRPVYRATAGGSFGGYRGIHGDQRRVDAGLAAAHAAVAGRQDVPAFHPGRPLSGHAG